MGSGSLAGGGLGKEKREKEEGIKRRTLDSSEQPCVLRSAFRPKISSVNHNPFIFSTDI